MTAFSFMGEFPGKVDSKGRIVLPSKFRSEMAKTEEQTFVIRKDFHEKCLMAYPESEWEKLMDEMSPKGNRIARKGRDIRRRLSKGTVRVEFAGNGRMNIADWLLESANIKNDVVLTGLTEYIEIWDKEEYALLDADSENFSDELESNFEDSDLPANSEK